MATKLGKPGPQGTWQQRKEHLRPYLDSVFVPLKTIWADPLGRPGAVIFSIVLLIALFAPLLATHDPNLMNVRTEGRVVQFTGGTWGQEVVAGDIPITSFAWQSSGQGVAVGPEGALMNYRESQGWTTVDSPTDSNLYAVDAQANLALAAGAAGTVLLYDGNSWRSIDSGVDVDLYGVAVSSPTQALIVGADGVVLRWDGNALTNLDSGTSHTLRSVSMSSADSGVVVGDRGTILHYTDGHFSKASFRSFMDSTFRRLSAVDVTSDYGFAVGERGTIMGFDGEDWYNMTSPESRELRDVAVLSSDEAYAVGIRGIVLQYDGASWQTMRHGYRRDFRGVSVLNGQGIAYGTDPYINELAPPSRDHLFGTTHLGRDIWSQVMYGSRTALLVGVIAALVVNLIGVTVGLVSGYYRGRVDAVLMRIVDIMYGFPLEPFAIILVLIFRPSLWIIIMAIGLLTWRTNARIIRSQVLSLAQRPFVKAAKVAGASNLRIMLVHIAPNILPLAFLQLAVAMGYAITAEATLSFLGLGPPQMYSWGTILHAARLSGAWRTAWWWVIPPGLFICVTVVSVFLISRSLEVLTNPRLRGGNNRAPRGS